MRQPDASPGCRKQLPAAARPLPRALLAVLLLALLLATLLNFNTAHRAVHARMQFGTLRPYGLCVPRYTLRFRKYDLPQRALQLHHIRRSLNITLPFTTVAGMRRAALEPAAPSATRPASPAPSVAAAPSNTSQQRFAILSLHSQGHLAPLFRSFVNLTIANLQRYADRHGYRFLYNTSHLVHNSGRDADSAFWGKVVLVKHFLPRVDWLLWSDLDVLILEQQIPLHTFTRLVPPQYHVIVVPECGRRDFEVTTSTASAGFFLVRRSKEAFDLVNAWLDLVLLAEGSPTPDQDAFVALFLDPQWRPYFYVYPSFLLSCYSECYDPGVFSVHFANTQRKECIPQWVQRLQLLEGGVAQGVARSGERA